MIGVTRGSPLLRPVSRSVRCRPRAQPVTAARAMRSISRISYSAATRRARAPSTSPPSFTAAIAVERRRPCVTIATRAAGSPRDARQLRDRMDLERGADAQQHVGARGELGRPLQRVLRQELAEQHDVGLQRPRRSRSAARHLVRGEPRAHLGQRAAGAPQPGTSECSIVPWTSIELARAGLAVQHVDVLGDHRVEQPAPLELDQRARERRWAACPRSAAKRSP